MTVSTRSRIRGSALWAAYGDALGFITELTGVRGLKERAGVAAVETTIPWRRRVGGRGGPTVELPPGCISDDTQLRLATARAILSSGEFDVEAFSKIELPVWSVYALGGGRGTTAAVNSLRRRGATWATNFFAGDRIDYLNAGGNGTAMRVQPHAWALSTRGDAELVEQVVMNAVCTHGHPRGILGAVFHAMCVKNAVNEGTCPEPADLMKFARSLRATPETFSTGSALNELWRAEWEKRSKLDLEVAADQTADEIIDDIGACSNLSTKTPSSSYQTAVDILDLRDPSQRGSGTKTAVAAGIAAWLFQQNPEAGMRSIANELGTDTDSIGTMAGAILGVGAGEELPGVIVDREYISHEADRMAAIASGSRAPSFQYPDLLAWTPPKNAVDCVGTEDSELHVAGLGPTSLVGKEVPHSEKAAFTWQWLDLWFGQRILAKRRTHPKTLPPSQRVHSARGYLIPSLLDPPPSGTLTAVPPSSAPLADIDPGKSLHQLTNEVIAADFDPALVGRFLLLLAERESGVEESIAFASIVAKARLTRRDRSRRNEPTGI